MYKIIMRLILCCEGYKILNLISHGPTKMMAQKPNIYFFSFCSQTFLNNFGICYLKSFKTENNDELMTSQLMEASFPQHLVIISLKIRQIEIILRKHIYLL